MKRILEKILQGTTNHFSWFLPGRLGRLTVFFLKFLFSGVRLETEQAAVFEHLPPDAVVVLITKHKSRLERLFFFTRRQGPALPCPEIGFCFRDFLCQPLTRLIRIFVAHLHYYMTHFKFPDPLGSGYIRKELERGRAGIIPLVGAGTCFRQNNGALTDPLQFLLAMQRTSERPICLVPFLFFYGNPSRTAARRTLGRLTGADPKPSIWYRLFLLLTAPETVFVEISEPLNLKAYIQKPPHAYQSIEGLALTLRHDLLDRITRHRQSLTGPILKPIEEIRQQILTSSRLRVFMRSWAGRRQLSMRQVRKEALKIIDEIAARPNPFVIRIAAGLVNRLLNHMFEGISVNVQGLKKMRRASREGPLIIMPCHKSNMDSIVISHVITRHGMPCPHFFAGKNLAFWPMGPIFRRIGAFFVRRSFKGAVFYARVFSEYIHMLLQQGFNIAVFIEGTRSRNGKLLLPKVGMLATVLNAVKNGACETLNFVPVFIGYDRVPELGSYIHELEGGRKDPENFIQMIKARKLLKNRFGKVYLKFCDPISLQDLARDTGGAVTELTPKQLNALCRDTAGRVLAAINASTVVTPQALVSASILNNPTDVITRSQLQFTFETYLTHLVFQQVDLSESLHVNPVQSFEHVIQYYTRAKYIRCIQKDRSGKGLSWKIKVNPNKRFVMEYYKNNCIAAFIPAALTAMSILSQDSFLFAPPDLYDRYQFLRDFFQNEFNYPPGETPEHQIHKTIDAFMDDTMVVPDPNFPGSYRLTSRGLRKIKSFAAFLRPLLQSYWIVLTTLRFGAKNGLNKAARLKTVQAMGHRMYKQGEIDRKEALSRVNYENALEFYTRNGLTRSGGAEKIACYESEIRNYLSHLSP